MNVLPGPGSSGRTVTRLCILALASAVLAVPAGCGGHVADNGGRMKVAATIVPLADFCRQVGGDLVEVRTLIPPGASAHSYEPTASEFKFLGGARVFVMNGLGLEEWASGVIRKAGPGSMVVVVTADAVPKAELLRAGAFGGEKGSGREYDPHIWLDPNIAAFQVGAIRDGFIEADPAHRERYTANASRFIRELEALDREIRDATAGFTRRSFVALHPGWAYFSRRYGIEQAAAVQEVPEQEPSGRRIERVVEEIKAKGIKVIFAEPQASARAAQVIASSIPGVRVFYLDPLGDPGNPEVDTYLETMRHNLRVMKEVLR